jgi:hypothetical protein
MEYDGQRGAVDHARRAGPAAVSIAHKVAGISSAACTNCRRPRSCFAASTS